MRCEFLSVGLICLSTTSVLAGEMPRYDVAAHCEAVAGFGGSHSEMIERTCFDQEQGAYDALKPNWPALPESMRDHCDRIATFGGKGSYMLLGACIQQEQQAAGANGKRKFKY